MLKNILRHRIFIISILGAATIALGLFALRTRIDGSITTVLPKNDPAFLYNQKIEERFGSTEEIIFLVSSEGPVFDKNMLTAVVELVETIGSLKGVGKDEALSITVLANTLPETNAIDISVDMADEDVEAIREAIENNPLFAGKLVGIEGNSTIVTFPISREISYNDELLKGLVKNIDESLAEIRETYPFITIEMSGHPVIQAAIMRYMSNDLLRLFPLALAVVMIILLIALRSLRAMLIPIMVTLISIIWAFGLKGLFKSPITITETVIPVILISLGCADGIHILSEFLHYYKKNLPPVLAVKLTMKKLNTPVILTSVTTAVGFSSLAFSSGSSLRNMGLYLAFGVVVAMGFSLLYIPIILASFSFKKEEKPELFKKRFSRMRFLQHTALGIMRYWPIPVTIVLAMLGLSVFGLIRTQPDTDEVRYFKASTPVRQVTEHIEESFGGIGTLYIVFESNKPDRFKEADVIYALNAIQEEIEANDNVGYTVSVANYVKMLFYSLRNKDPDSYILPESNLLVKRLIGMLASPEMRENRMLYNYIDEEFSSACLQVRLKDSNTKKMKALLSAIGPVLAEQTPSDITVNFAGDYIRLKMGESIVRSQIVSLLVTIATVLVILSVFFRSPIIGMLITFPVSVAILFNFAVMWFSGVSLNPATAIIASVGLGVGVDYGIHFFSRFRILYLKSGKYIHSIVDAVVETSKGIFSNALAVGIGFLVLLFSSYSIINDMGWIVAVSMMTSALLTITMIPVFLFLFKPKVPVKISFAGGRKRKRAVSPGGEQRV